MPIAPAGSTPPLTFTIGDLILDALIETGAVSPGEGLDDDSDMAQWALRKSNYMIDMWSARRPFVYSWLFNLYTLQAGLSPHTIGNSGAATFDTTPNQRPVFVESAALLLNSSSSTGLVDQPIKIRDRAWWAAQQTKNIQTNIPTDLFYDATYPDGSLYFWPVPNSGFQVRLQLWQSISSFTQITDPIGGPNGPGTLPQGYRNAMMVTLAEYLAPGLNKTLKPATAKQAMEARKAIFGNNIRSPRMATRDAGMPKSTGKRGDFNWMTGGRPGGPPE